MTRWRAGSRPRRLHAAIVLLASEGRQDVEIARTLGVDRLTVARWRRRFLQERTAGLAAPAHVTRPGRIAEERLQAVVRASVGAPPRGSGRWSTRRLAAEFGVSHMTVRRLWHAYGLRPSAFPLPGLRADPTAPNAPWDVVGVFFAGPTAVLGLTLHPRVASAGLGGARRKALPRVSGKGAAPSLGVRPPVGGAFRRLASEAGPPPGTSGTVRVRRFIDALSARVGPATAMRLLITGPPADDAAWFERWRVRHPRVELVPLSDLSAWRERATDALDAIGAVPGPRRQFRGRAELSVALRRTVASYDGQARPFVWIAPAAAMAAGEAAYRLRYDLAVTAREEFKAPQTAEEDVAAISAPRESDRASARAILRENLRVRPGERVTIEAWTQTLGYGNAFVLEAMKLGARPLLLYEDEPTYWAASTEVPARQLGRIGEHRRAALERTDVFVSFLGPSDRERFHALPSATLFRLGEYQDALYSAAAKAGARAVQMAVGRVSAASARMYHVEENAWREELVSGTLVSPRALGRRAAAVVRRLTRGSELTVRHPNGTELALGLRGLAPQVSDGRVPRPRERADWSLVTLPAGVVTVAVDERTADGTFRSNMRCSTGLSDSVGDFSDGRWTFTDGRLRRFEYDVGQAIFEQSYARAREGRDRPGSIAIGLNERIVSAPLLEDQSLGMVTLQIGRNDHVGGRTRTPWWAWTFLRGATVAIDGRPVLRDGKLVP